MKKNPLAWLFGGSAKFTTGMIGQGLTFALAYYGHGNKWVTLAVAAAAALGIYAVPNASPSPPMAPAPGHAGDTGPVPPDGGTEGG